MNERHIFSDSKLIEILISVIRTHSDVSEGFPYARDVSAVRQANDYANLTMQIDLAALTQLTDHLRVVTAVDPANDLNIVAHLMANVAITVYKGGPIFADKRQQVEQINPLAYKIRTEFSIVCASSFACFHGCAIDVSNLPNDKIFLALLVNDWERLVRIFEVSLRVSPQATWQNPPEFAGGGESEAVIQHFERQFAETSPVPEPGEVNANRQLSAESYWNLRSVADQEHWDAADVLDLIEAHLSPVLHSHLAFRRSIVTGDEWRRFYDWIHREDGHTLWRVGYESSRKSYLSPSVGRESLPWTFSRLPRIFR